MHVCQRRRKREKPPLETGLLREKENEVLGSVKKKKKKREKIEGLSTPQHKNLPTKTRNILKSTGLCSMAKWGLNKLEILQHNLIPEES